MKNRKLINQDGLTLLEVMIALLIMSMSLLLLLNMAMVALDGNDWANNTTLATQLMQDKLEQLRATSSPTTGSDTQSGVARSWTVSSLGSNLLQVDIHVNWENVKGQSQSDSLTAYIKP